MSSTAQPTGPTSADPTTLQAVGAARAYALSISGSLVQVQTAAATVASAASTVVASLAQVQTAAQAVSTQAATVATTAASVSTTAALAQAWATQTTTEVVVGQGYGARKYASDASGYANAASLSAATSLAAQSASAISQANTLATFQAFRDVYQGSSTTPPTLRPDGGALQYGDLYYDTSTPTLPVLRIYAGSTTGWIAAATASALQATNNLSDLQSAKTALVNLGIDKLTARGDAAYTILATDRTVALTAALTAPRTWTLPAATGKNPGAVLRVTDQIGGISSTNTLTLAAAGSDTINGAASAVLATPFAALDLVCDGAGKWTYDIQGILRGGTGATTVSGAQTALNLVSGTSAGQLVRLDGNAKLPAVDGSQLTNIAGVPTIGDTLATFNPPTNGTWLRCDGSIYNQSAYATLFARLGHAGMTYGAQIVRQASGQGFGFGRSKNINGNIAYTAAGTVAQGTWYYTTDGVTIATLRATTFDVAWNGTNYLVVTTTGLGYATTINGTYTANGAFTGYAITASPTVIVTADGTNFYRGTSVSGAATTVATPFTVSALSYGAGPGIFVAVGANGIASSTDGLTWTTRMSLAGAGPTFITYGNGVFIANGAASVVGGFYRSTDGINWALIPMPFNPAGSNVSFDGNLFLAMLSNNPGSPGYYAIAVSRDGINWIVVQGSGQTNANACAGLPGFILYSEGATLWYRPAAYTVASQFAVPLPVFTNIPTWIKAA